VFSGEMTPSIPNATNSQKKFWEKIIGKQKDEQKSVLFLNFVSSSLTACWVIYRRTDNHHISAYSGLRSSFSIAITIPQNDEVTFFYTCKPQTQVV